MLLFSVVEWSPIILAAITGTVSIVTLFLQILLKRSNDRQEVRQVEQAGHIDEVHKQIDGRMDEMLAMKKEEGKTEQKDETESKKP